MPTALPLTEATLPRLGGRLRIPRYDRRSLRRGVVHISVGSFHRSHQAVYFDELAQRGLGDGWALTGVGVRRRDMKEALAAQDGLYTVVSRAPGHDEARVVGVITRYLFAPEETGAVLDALVDADTRLVTLTITSAGYGVDADPAALGLLIEALDRRRRLGRAPFTILSCDNIAGNGELPRAAVLELAARRDDRLATWIERHGAFPSSMVDRITPSTTDAARELVERRFGVRDRWPVITEPFSQWVIEDAFADGRPPLEEVGVQFVSDVRPYALMKTRLLNAGHLALGFLGTLAGHERTDQAVLDPLLGAYLGRLMDDEIAPLLPPVDTDLDHYTRALRRRFANGAVADPLTRLCRNASAKVPTHLLSSIREARTVGRPHEMLTLAVSAWCRTLRMSPAPDDEAGRRLHRLALLGGADPRPLLADEETFGALGRDPGFTAAVRRDLDALAWTGPRGAIAARLGRASEAVAA